MEKIYLDEDKKIWIIENFLTQEELEWFKTQTDDELGWYPTMRSPYKNILNKFLNVVPRYDEDGNIEFPNETSENIIKYTSNYLVKVYPGFFRTNSNNLNAVNYWNYGFQIGLYP